MTDQGDSSTIGEQLGDDDRVRSLSNWLIEQAFGDPDIVDVFGGMCDRLRGFGMPIDRAYLAWPTLHPMIDAESVFWWPDRGALLETYPHDNVKSEQWLQSPMRFVIERGLRALRRRLAGPDAQLDFPVLRRLADEGFTDYLLLATRYSIPRVDEHGEPGGILVSWATRHPDGFTDRQIAELQLLQRRIAIACKTMALSRITRNIADAYLGRVAARRVLSGQIRHGDGEAIEAVVWYSDLRNSTAHAETMPEDRYMELLNHYFECTAGAALAAGGEVLDFIGDAVLAIFPHEAAGGQSAAAQRACRAIAEADKRRGVKLADNPALPLDFGIGVDSGRLKFGNIGVPERLAFSVVGPTVNQVARIEKYTKALGVLALATPRIANASPGYWDPVGEHTLAGLSGPVALLAWKGGGHSPA